VSRRRAGTLRRAGSGHVQPGAGVSAAAAVIVERDDRAPQRGPIGAVDLLDAPGVGVTAIRGGALRIGSYFLGLLASVVSSALLLRHLGVVASGDYITVISLVSLALAVTDAGLATIGVHELSTLSAASVDRFFKGVLGLRLALALSGVLFAVLFATFAGYRSTLVWGTLLAGGGFALAGWQVIYSVPLLAQMRLGWVAALEGFKQLGAALATILLVIVGAPLLPFWAATIPAALVVTILNGWLIRHSAPLRPAFDRAVWGPLLRRMLPYSVASAVGIVYFRLAILIMSNVASGRQTGYFAASFRIIEVLFILPQLIVGSMLPIFSRAARDDRGRLDHALGRTFDVCLLLGLATGLALVSGAPFIIEVIAGPRFAPSAPVLRIQGVALVATFVGAVLSYGLISLRRYRAVLLINVTVLLLSGALTGALAEQFGAKGAASATAFVEALYTAMLAGALIRAGVRPKLSVGGALRATLATLLALSALALPGLPSVVEPLLVLTIYVVALLWFGAVPAEVMKQIPRPRRRRYS
jgi:O-antigen/teichoic acid export membrane protein